MPFIWNNKEYKLVPDSSNWDKLEFVVARKLHVQYKPEQKISIETIKSNFGIYGSLARIELFRDNFTSTKFAHVTFKENVPVYCVLLDVKHQVNTNIEIIRPADIHLQPDNPVDPSTSPFTNLTDDCLLAIFEYCDFHALATLSSVCKKLSELLRTRIFANIPKFNSVATNDAEVANGLSTVSRLVQCINPPNFHLKICRDLHSSDDWPAMSVDTSSSKSEVSIEMDFFKYEWLSQLEKITKRIKSVHLHRSVYDSVLFDQAILKVSFPIATKLTISGYATSCFIPDMSKVVSSLPKLEMVCLRNGAIKWDHVVKYCKSSKNLRDIIFEECVFDYEVKMVQISQIAGVIKNCSNRMPLRLMFDRIRTKYPKQDMLCSCERCANHYHAKRDIATDRFSCGCDFLICPNCGLCVTRATSAVKLNTKESTYDGIKAALEDETVRKYVRIQIGREPFSD